MSDELLTILKFVLLALLYLFFFRVLRAVWVELNPPRALERAPAAGGGYAPPVAAAPPNLSKRQARKIPTQLTVLEPADQRGRVFPLAAEMTLGRAGGCQVAIPEDTFASQIHARIFSRDGQTWVEDLGSTNGTFVNRSRVTAAVAVQRGDQVQIGNTVLELG
ncbi:FHA domain-containing protein [Iamia sp. SCSIO 61187]|uniref:FHA domain-containing protein n=1 Tax=Iamia sp. SCSIO 61187 TaxID=2722752 RepID=UPI001C639884|nr:FHA domain-containing protein [Iamia sp. SCSIO 61187]QYG91055.1 FHA domain-containing protein [Iamia sp. SCSIO 61187]